MDFSADGSESMKFTAAEVSDIQNSALALGGDGARKVVTAYVSIGETSEFRSYSGPAWTIDGTASGALRASTPSWLGPFNPDFPDRRSRRCARSPATHDRL
jgi:endo-alpha-1,4-polygalactosaminidase (GH114 family)